jgi:hypothetical protein
LKILIHVKKNFNLAEQPVEITEIKNKDLEDTFKFVNELEEKIINMNNLITDEIMDKTILMKNMVEDSHDATMKKLTENFTCIKEILSELSVNRINLLDSAKEKIMKDILMMQQYYGIVMMDLIDCNLFLI